MLAILDKWGSLPISPIWPNLKKLQHCSVQNQNWKGVCVMKKMPTHVFEAPQCGPLRTNRGVFQAAQNGQIFNFETISFTKSKLKEGIFHGKNWHLMYLGPYGAGHFGYVHPVDQPYMGRSIFFWSFAIFKSKIKKLLQTRICLIGIGWLAHAPQPSAESFLYKF